MLLTGCAQLIVADLVIRGTTALVKNIETNQSDVNTRYLDSSNTPTSLKSTIEECIFRYNEGRPHSNAIHFCELGMANGKGGEYRVADMYEQGSGGAYTDKSKALQIYKECVTKSSSMPSEIDSCQNKVKFLEAFLKIQNFNTGY